MSCPHWWHHGQVSSRACRRCLWYSSSLSSHSLAARHSDLFTATAHTSAQWYYRVRGRVYAAILTRTLCWYYCLIFFFQLTHFSPHHALHSISPINNKTNCNKTIIVPRPLPKRYSSMLKLKEAREDASSSVYLVTLSPRLRRIFVPFALVRRV